MHVERVAGQGDGYAETAIGNASLGLCVGPAPVGAGLDYALADGVQRGYLLPSFHVAVEETLDRELAEGLHGWRLTDIRVRVVHSRFSAPTPSAGEFRRLTHLAFRQALARAGTTVCAPLGGFELTVPAESLTSVLSMLVGYGAAARPSRSAPAAAS